jgi:hypothetical protein
MKSAAIVFAFVVALVLLLCIYIIAAHAGITVPEECKGKTVECVGGGIMSCTLMNCPYISIYDDNGKFIGYKETCRNHCSRAPTRCSCGDLEFIGDSGDD